MKKLLADKGQVIAEKEQLISLAKAKFVQLEEKIQGIAGQQKELERELIRLGAQLEQAELREGQLAEEESNCQQRLVQLEQRLQAVREQLQGISAMLDKDKAGLDKLGTAKIDSMLMRQSLRTWFPCGRQAKQPAAGCMLLRIIRKTWKGSARPWNCKNLQRR